MKRAGLLLILLSIRVCAEDGKLQGKTPPAPDNVRVSGDGAFRWSEGERTVVFRDPRSGRERRVRLPVSPGIKRFQVIFAERGRHFCVLEELDQEVGLHLGVRRGAKKAKTLVLAARLRLVDKDGASLWIKDMPEGYAVGAASEARSIKIAENGALAILLQDVDPYGKASPVLTVISPRGTTLLRLDYASWTKIDEFALSPGGRRLAVRGYGSIPEEERWDKAAAVYVLDGKKPAPRVLPLPEAGAQRDLRSVGDDGWACCARLGGAWTAFDPEGRLRPAP
jgi:hypothetical protein